MMQSEVGSSCSLLQDSENGGDNSDVELFTVQSKMEKVTIPQQQNDKKVETLIMAINQETNQQTYVPSGSMEIIVSVPIKPKATKLKMVQALLDLGADDDHVDPDLFKEGILSSWLDTASHKKNVGKYYVGGNDSFQGCESIKIVGSRLPSFTTKSSLNWS